MSKKIQHRILHLVTDDTGGAAIAVMRLHEALLKQGHESAVLVLNKKESYPHTYELKQSVYKKIAYRILNKIQFSLFRKTLHNNKFFFRIHSNIRLVSANDILNSIPFIPTSIVVHWITGFVNFKHLKKIEEITKATLFFNHLDMSLLTGGCHYSFGCGAFSRDCEACPAIHNSLLKNLAKDQLQFKKKFMPRNAVSIIPSAQLAKQASISSIFSQISSQRVIIGIDPEVYKPGEKVKLRESLNLSANKRYFLFGAETITDERKGFSFLLKALKMLSNELTAEQRKEVFLIIIGKPSAQEQFLEEIPFEYLLLPYAKDYKALIKYYQIADVFLCPSVEDSGPMMINEAIMCGLPVVAFENGVATDLIAKENGYVAQLKDTEDFKNGLLKYVQMNHEDLKKSQLQSREMALSKYTMELYVSRFVEILNLP